MRIIIADDHIIFRDGLKLLFTYRGSYQVVAETGDLGELKALVREHQPDMLIMDYNMPGGEGGEVLAYLKHRYPGLRVLVLTAERSGPLLKHLAAAGADGLLLKEGSAEELLAAVQRIAGGGKVLADEARAKIDAVDFELTARELQVLRLIGAGLTNAAIAERFSLSTRTVDKHRENLLRKLGANNVVQLLGKARELRLLESPPG